MTSGREIDDDFALVNSIPVASMEAFRLRRSRSPSRRRQSTTPKAQDAPETRYGRVAMRERHMREAEQQEDPNILNQVGGAWSLLETSTEPAASSAAAPRALPTVNFTPHPPAAGPRDAVPSHVRMVMNRRDHSGRRLGR